MFWKKKKKKNQNEDLVSNELPKDGKLSEELTELAAKSDRKELSRADIEVSEAVTKANRTDIRNYLLIDKGRCPVCHSRTENFLFTVVCPSCGWFKRNIPEKGSSRVYLTTGKSITCDYVHRGGTNEFLLIKDGVVIAEIMRSGVLKIEHLWEEHELKEMKEKARKTKTGICAWCETPLHDSETDDIFEDYVAFGAFQEHYVFCCEEHQRAFRKRYPSRVHRNCYETDCNSCNLCMKRFDTFGFKRNILT